MCQLNKAGASFATLPGVTALTDVTGFKPGGASGGASCEGSQLQACLEMAASLLPHLDGYLAAGCVPGGTERNFDSYGQTGPLE